jgi:hypothetical protein
MLRPCAESETNEDNARPYHDDHLFGLMLAFGN